MRIRQSDEHGSLSATAAWLFVGAGDGRDLSTVIAAGASRIVVVEPDPDLAAELRASKREVTVVPAALADEPGQAVFRRYNFSLLSGLAEPATAMRTIFPGLSQLHQVEVDCTTLTALMDYVDFQSGQSTVLVVNAPAFASQAVAALLQLPVAMRFEDIILRAPTQPLFKGTADLSGLTERLTAAGYVEISRNQNDISLPLVHFHLDRTALALSDSLAWNERLKSSLVKMRARVRNSRHQMQAAREDAEKMSCALAEKSAEARQATANCNAATAALNELQSTFAEEATLVRSKLQEEVSSIYAAKAERDALLAKLESLTSEQKTLLSKLKAQVDVAQALQERTKALQENETLQQARVDELAEALRGSEGMVESLRRQLSELKTDATNAASTFIEQEPALSADARSDDRAKSDRLERLLKREREANNALREEFQRMNDQVALFNSVLADSRSLARDEDENARAGETTFQVPKGLRDG